MTMTDKLCLFVCDNYIKEALTVINAEGFDDVHVLSYPSDCERPQDAGTALRKIIRSHNDKCSHIEVLGGGCIGKSGNCPKDFSSCYVRSTGLCFYMFVNGDIIDRYLNQRAFLLTPGWLKHWQKKIKKWGFDQKTAREFFKESSATLVLLDTGVRQHAHKQLRELSDYVGLRHEILPIGLGFFRLFLSDIINKWRIENSKGRSSPDPHLATRQLADYSMVSEVIVKLTEMKTEAEVIDRIFDLFNMLFAPLSLAYLPFINNTPGEIRLSARTSIDGKALRRRLAGLQNDYLWTRSGRGFQLRFRHKDKTIGCMEIDGLTFPQYKGHYLNLALTISSVCGLAIDNARAYEQIEEAKRLMEKSEREYRTLVETMSEGLGVVDEKGIITYSNSRLCSMLGESRDRIIGRPVISFLDEENRKIVEKQAVKRRKGKAEPYEITYLNKSGLKVHTITSPQSVFDADGNFAGSFAVITDITERRQTEAKLNMYLNKLEKANQELSDFAYTVSHDLKEPMRAVHSLAKWIVNDYADKFDDKGKEKIYLLMGRVRRINDLIEGILRYSRAGSLIGEKKETDLNQIASEIIDILDPPENIHIEIEGKLPVVLCEQTSMSQVFQNLIGNAVKYMDKPEGKIRISSGNDGEFWKICVSDNGPGIAKKDYQKIFRLFSVLRPRDHIEANGVGLAIVKKIIDMYGGNIWVESETGKGSRFYFTIHSS